AKGAPKDAFAVVGLPTTFIIDKQGRIREKILAPRTLEQFTAILQPLVEEKSPVAQK
ncbi:MAG: hypothetical protein H7Z37_01585, partial [Pyrinomonadaceae bacterium]|nr:hypothetical protein [Pyrinomonadaceae bacterium]